MHSTEDVGFQPRVRHPGEKSREGRVPGIEERGRASVLSWLGSAFSYGKMIYEICGICGESFGQILKFTIFERRRFSFFSSWFFFFFMENDLEDVEL